MKYFEKIHVFLWWKKQLESYDTRVLFSSHFYCVKDNKPKVFLVFTWAKFVSILTYGLRVRTQSWVLVANARKLNRSIQKSHIFSSNYLF
jgi:hypothetical protein